MNDDGMAPEERLLRAVFGTELAEAGLAAAFAAPTESVARQLEDRIRAGLESLSYRERGVIEMRFGLGDGCVYTLAQAGYVFDLTRERIRQIQTRGLRRLRARLQGLRNYVNELGGNE